MSQTAEIYEHLKEGNSITPIEALDRFGCFRLGARIKELKNMGVTIDRKMIKTVTGKRVAEYSLA